ncbi:endonuclease domain-containing protein [uncultured Cyclobacterium sp.]|uniref:endonuclease domain-containing protein n=1 Tax=uncultured Cyclobacterium sp. TaxID=453820 RepID=UPI0030EFA142|tara:strand:+ start:103388 stop:103783 length:396 start_codon:yes stop_codon:yes gene_type:complete
MHFLPYNKNLKEFSRDLRTHSTLSEVLLWQKLKGRQFRGYAFNRQKPLGHFIVDFYSKKLQLVIEIDGDSHLYPESVVQDQKRQLILVKMDLFFLRFLDRDVKKSMPYVLMEIGNYIDNWELKNDIPKTSF